jgi:RNA polymerase sigma factor for flagellar operon FliA
MTIEPLAHARRETTCLGTIVAEVSGYGETTTTVEDALVEESVSNGVRDAVRRLPARERAIVRGFYFDGRALTDVAADMGLSKSWVSRIHGATIGRLRERLSEVG